MSRVYYLAYGSNLHPLRLRKRVPSARLVGVAELAGARIVFHKRGRDESGKCMLLSELADGASAYGAVFAMAGEEVALLDRFEGCGRGYDRQAVSCQVQGASYRAFTYVADIRAVDPALAPYHWYKQLVLAGARYHRFPQDYIATLEAVVSIADPDVARRQEHERLLQAIHGDMPGIVQPDRHRT